MTLGLLEQLPSRHNLPLLDADNFAHFVLSHRHVVLFFANNPLLFPESHDVAVILPELLKVFAQQLQGAIIADSIEKELQAQYRFTSWPSLVFLRNGDYLGVISGIKDWQQYKQAFAEILAAEPSQPPSFDLNKACGAGHA